MKIKDIRKKLGSSKNKNWCILMLVALLSASLVVNSGLFSTEQLPLDDDTTPTTTTNTTTSPTTTPPEEDSFYTVLFSFVWGASIADTDKCWIEFAVYDYHDITSGGKRDAVTLGAGHGDTGDWFEGSWGAEFTGGEQVSIGMESFLGWYNFEDPFYVDTSVGSWSSVFTFYSYKYGFSIMLTGELRVSWELI